MHLSFLDGVIVAAYFIFVLVVGILFTKKAGKSVSEFFVSGRKLNWWLAGTSMVATTFAADTPLAVTGLVALHGIQRSFNCFRFCPIMATQRSDY